jgi:hypothetical protein
MYKIFKGLRMKIVEEKKDSIKSYPRKDRSRNIWYLQAHREAAIVASFINIYLEVLLRSGGFSH